MSRWTPLSPFQTSLLTSLSTGTLSVCSWQIAHSQIATSFDNIPHFACSRVQKLVPRFRIYISHSCRLLNPSEIFKTAEYIHSSSFSAIMCPIGSMPDCLTPNAQEISPREGRICLRLIPADVRCEILFSRRLRYSSCFFRRSVYTVKMLDWEFEVFFDYCRHRDISLCLVI